MSGPLIISASQLETKARCDRLWFFQKKLRLPEPETGSNRTLGSVLHAVIERYLRSESLYPADWYKHKERDGKVLAITPREQSKVKQLVAAGIEAGIIEPKESQRVEHEFRLQVMEGVDLFGFIDVLEPCTVIDHKTAKNDRYLKTDRHGTANYLGDNIQMLTYANVALREAEILGGSPSGITVRHNQFIKDDDETRPVRAVETVVSREKIQEHWAWIQAQAASMLRLKEVKDWESIQAPNQERACQAYGGCSFAGICGGTESIESYKERLVQEQTPVTVETMFEGLGSDRKYQTKEATMATMKFFKPKSGNPAPPSMPEAPSINAPTATKEPEVQEDKDRVVAPWAIAACKACQGTGMNSKGAACRICDNTNKSNGMPTSEDYNARWDVDEGKLVWDDPEGTVAPPVKEEEVVEEEEEEQENPDEVEEPAPTKTEKAEKPVLKVEPEKKTRGRKKKGITLLVNCTFTKGPNTDNHRIEDLLHKFGAALAEAQGEDNYFALGAFDRRDMIAQRAEEIAEFVGTATVEVRTATSPDVNALVAALKPYVGSVIEGTCG